MAGSFNLIATEAVAGVNGNLWVVEPLPHPTTSIPEPNIFKFDGTSWSNIGPIPYDTPYPPDNYHISADANGNAHLSEAAGLGVVLTSQDDPDCAPYPCPSDWSFDLATGNGSPLAAMDRVHGVYNVTTTSGGIHFGDSNTYRTISAEAADFGSPLTAQSAESDAWTRVRALSGGFLSLQTQYNTVGYFDRSNPANGWTDLGLDDAVTIGTDRAGLRAIIGTASGEVFLLEASAPTTLISLGSIPGAKLDLSLVDASWIRITAEQMAVWLFNSGPAHFYMRQLPDSF